MFSLAEKLEDETIVQEVGTVARIENGTCVTRTAYGEYRAKKAASCLLEPRTGDVVLLCALPQGETYILAVLEQKDGTSAKVELDGDLEIKLRCGHFTVAAASGVDLASSKDVSVTSSGFRVNAAEGSMVFQRLAFLGTLVRAEVEQLKVIAAACDSVMDRIVQKVKRSYRFVEGADHVRAERIDYNARQNVSVHGKNALVTAEELVKLDGEQVHIG